MSLLESAGLGNGMVVLVAGISNRADHPHISLFVSCMSRNFPRIVNVGARNDTEQACTHAREARLLSPRFRFVP
jgi:hypothetical protein